MPDEKTADVRLLDVFVLGPFMIWFGFRARGVPDLARGAMIVAGVGTILYNYATYRESIQS
jgi:hypothetical protein